MGRYLANAGFEELSTNDSTHRGEHHRPLTGLLWTTFGGSRSRKVWLYDWGWDPFLLSARGATSHDSQRLLGWLSQRPTSSPGGLRSGRGGLRQRGSVPSFAHPNTFRVNPAFLAPMSPRGRSDHRAANTRTRFCEWLGDLPRCPPSTLISAAWVVVSATPPALSHERCSARRLTGPVAGGCWSRASWRGM